MSLDPERGGAGEAAPQAGDAIGLADLVIIGDKRTRQGHAPEPDRSGDVMEALIAAIYLDGGLEAARAFVLRNWAPLLAHPSVTAKDAKTYLQEWALARALPIPAYRVISREGPEHEPVFVVSVEIKGKPSAEGRAKSKRAAEQEAADMFLKREGIRP